MIEESFNVFISYAYEDISLCKELDKHLSLLKQRGLINAWTNNDISPGMDWKAQITEHLNDAHIILLLLSADFMDSDFCYGVEMVKALERHKAGEARVIPIILRPLYWEDAPFAHLKALPTGNRPVTKWSSRDLAFVDIVKGIVEVIEELKKGSPAHDVNASGKARKSRTRKKAPPQMPVWNVPFRRNPFFTGRQDVLTKLHTTLAEMHTTALVQPSAMSGLGGIGKTQAAVEYAYRHRDDYQYTLWVQADSHETLVSEYVTLAHLLKLPVQNLKGPDDIFGVVRRWMEKHNGWLLILDNVENLQVVEHVLPEHIQGHVLITTRNEITSGFARNIAIEKMEVEEGVIFLLRRAAVLNLDAPLPNTLTSDYMDASAIVQEMDGLPLALDQAGAYIEETRCSLRDYLKLFQTQRASLLKMRGERSMTHPDSVNTTFALAFAKVQQINPTAADLLRLCAFLASDAIPEEIFICADAYTVVESLAFADEQNGIYELKKKLGFKGRLLKLLLPGAYPNTPLFDPCEDLETPLRTLENNLHALNTAIKDLRKYSLIYRDARTHTLFMHRLFQAVLHDEMDADTQKQWVSLAIVTLARSFPDLSSGDLQARTDSERLLPHTLAVSASLQQNVITSISAIVFLSRMGIYFLDHAQYQMAEQFSQMALSMAERGLGKFFPNIGALMNILAKTYEAQGKFQEAQKLFRRQVAISKGALGKEHRGTVVSMNNLAQLYQNQGNYSKAEALHKRILALREASYGEENLDTAISMVGLGEVYRGQGRFQEAETLLLRARHICEKLLEADHPHLATTLNNLALIYQTQGKYEEAEKLHRQALAIREKVFDKEHPEIAMSLNNLAALYESVGRYADAIPLVERALKIYEKAVGAEHPNTGASLNALAVLYDQQKMYTKSEPLYEKALRICEKTLGPLHPNTLTAMNNLATIYVHLGKYAQAERLCKQALVVSEGMAGASPQIIAALLHTQGTLYIRQKKYVEAEQIMRRALLIYEKIFGPQHPNFAMTKANLAEACLLQGKQEEAETLFHESLVVCEKILGAQHPTTLGIRSYLQNLNRPSKHHTSLSHKKRR